MTQANIELLEALEVAGVPKEKARAAAASVAAAGDLATKADVRQLVEAAVAASEARLTWRLVGVAAVILAAIALK